MLSPASNQLSLTLAVTPGTSLVIDVRCYESYYSNTGFDAIPFCDTVQPKSNCRPDIRQFTLADYTGTVKYIASRWPVTKNYVKCNVTDPAGGSGTVTISGVRSWQ